METKLVELQYLSNKSWGVGGDGRSSFNLHFLEKNVQLPSRDDLQKILNELWHGTKAAYGYLAVKDIHDKLVVITLPRSTNPKLRARFVERLEEYLRSKK